MVPIQSRPSTGRDRKLLRKQGLADATIASQERDVALRAFD